MKNIAFGNKVVGNTSGPGMEGKFTMLHDEQFPDTCGSANIFRLVKYKKVPKGQTRVLDGEDRQRIQNMDRIESSPFSRTRNRWEDKMHLTEIEC
jgi:hypothetical protein